MSGPRRQAAPQSRASRRDAKPGIPTWDASTAAAARMEHSARRDDNSMVARSAAAQAVAELLGGGDGAAAQVLDPAGQRKWDHGPPDGNEPVADREPLAPDVVDHRVLGGGAGIHPRDLGVG